MPTGKDTGAEAPFDKQAAHALGKLDVMSNTQHYDSRALTAAHVLASELADRGFNSGQIDQVDTYKLKLDAAKRAQAIAEGHQDTITSKSLGQVISSHTLVLEMLDPPKAPVAAAKTQKKPRAATQTTRGRTSGAKK